MADTLWIVAVLIASHALAGYVGALLAHLDLARLDREAREESLVDAWHRDCVRDAADPDKETSPPGWDEANRWYKGAGK